ncbi:hypothetical protein SRHO_G00069310 [Serrasalmus rhombeus]
MVKSRPFCGFSRTGGNCSGVSASKQGRHTGNTSRRTEGGTEGGADGRTGAGRTEAGGVASSLAITVTPSATDQGHMFDTARLARCG